MNETINIPFLHVDKILYPLIKGYYINKDGEPVKGYYIIDSGATDNILNYKIIGNISNDCISKDSKRIVAVDNQGSDCLMADINIIVGSKISKETFCIAKNIDFEENFKTDKIIGILGVHFLYKNQFIIDFEKGCIRKSDKSPFNLKEKSFVFPMDFGLKTYGIPVIGIVKEEYTFVCLVDTGSDINLLTSHALNKGTSNPTYTERIRTISGIFGTMQSKIAETNFSILSIGEKQGELIQTNDSDSFAIIDKIKYLIDPGGKDIPPLSGIIGVGYMVKNKCILDFGNRIIYKNKYATIRH